LSGNFDGRIADLVYWSDGFFITAQNFSDIYDLGFALPPEVTINLPIEQNYSSSSIDFNVTLGEEGSCNYTLDEGGTNNSMSTLDDYEFFATNNSIADGQYMVRYYCAGLTGALNFTETRNFGIDTTNPVIEIIYPENKNYSYNTSIELNFSLTELNSDSCWYNLDEGSNTSLVDCQNSTFNASEGAHTLYVFANDSAGNFGTDQKSFFVDSVYPEISFGSGVEVDYANKSQSFIFANVSVIEDNEVNITFGLYDENYSVINETTFFSSVRSINFTGLGNGIYYYNVSVVDFANNFNFTQTRKITLDTSGPEITIAEPEDSKTYAINESLPLNYSVSDFLLLVDSCWWNLDGNSNSSIECGQNTTFNASDGDHIINFWANDSLGNVVYSNSSFAVSTLGPGITLNLPSDATYLDYLQNINFTYTPTDPDGVDTCVLYGDWGSGWHANQSDSVISNASLNEFIVNMTSDGDYIWNVWCNDTLGLTSFALSNYSFTLDTTSPVISFAPSFQSYDEELEWGYEGNPTNPENAVDEDFGTFATIDSPGEIDFIYVNYSVPMYVSSADLEYLVDWDVSAGEIQCFDYILSDWVLLDVMENNVQTNASVPVNCYADDKLQIRAYRSLSPGPGSVDFYEEKINWNVVSSEINEANKSENFVIVNVLVDEANFASISFDLFNDEGLVNSTVYYEETWGINFTNLNDDVYYYNATITDLANNKDYTQTRKITLDVTNPNATFVSPENDTYSNNVTQNFTVDVEDNIELVNATLYIFNSVGSLVYNSTVVLAGATFATVGVVYEFLSDGVFTWFYKVFDLAGNEYATENRTITIDTLNPVINFTVGTEDDGGEFERRFIFANVSVNETNFANITFSLSNDSGVVNESVFFDDTRSINWTDLSNANITYYYNVTVTDLANNINSTETRSIKLFDSVSPSLTLVNPTNTTYSYNESISLDYVASDLNLDSCWYNLDGGGNMSLPDCENTTIDVSDEQSHTLYLYANDSVGFVSNDNVTFFVNSSLVVTDDWIVYRDSTSVDGSSTDNIGSAVDSGKAFILLTARDGDSGPDSLQVTGKFLNSQTLQFDNYATGEVATAAWQVITGPDLDVQRGEVNYGTTNSSFSVDIDEVNLSNSFIIVYNRLNSGTNADNDEGFWRGSFSGSSSISFSRDVTGDAGVVSWQVVSWEGASVQSGSVSSGSNSYIEDITSAIDTEKSFLIFSSSGNGGLDDNHYGGYIINSTNLEFYRQDNDATMNIEWFVVELNSFRVESGSTSLTGSAGPFNAGLTRTLGDLSKSFSLAFADSTGGGTTFANAIFTHGLSSTSNIQFYKGTSSQTNNASYQVIELVEVVPPVVNLIEPVDSENFSSSIINWFKYNVSDDSSITNCSLYGNWSGGWHLEDTQDSPAKDTENSFNAVDVADDGIYLWNVECFDAYSNSAWASSNFSFVVDETYPGISFASGVEEDYSNKSQSFIFVNVSVNETNFLNITYGLYNESYSVVNETSFFDETLTINWTGLDEGIYYYNVSIYDVVGHFNSTSTRKITLDTTNPVIEIIYPENKNYSYNTSIELNFSLTELNSDSCWYNLDEGSNTSLVDCQNSTFNASEGAHTLYVFANDSAGNFGTDQKSFFVDSVYPEISFGSGVEVDYANKSQSFIFANVSVIEDNEVNITFGLYDENYSVINETTFFSSVRSINFTGLGNGIYYYNVSVVDFANNFNFTQTRKITLDTTNPNATFVSPENDTYSSNVTQNFTANVSDNIELVNATLYIFNSLGSLVYNSTVVLVGATFATVGITYEFLSDGVFTWFYKVFDLAGNEYATENQTITIDTLNPVINFTVGTEDSGENFSRSWIFANVSVNETNFANITFSLFNLSESINETTFFDETRTINWTGLDDGFYYYNATITDLADNINSTETREIGLDTTGPVVEIVYPEAKAYGYNVSLPLNYSISDNLVGYDSCWWHLDGGVNQSISCGQNTTFNTSDGEHTLYFYSNDSFNNVGGDEVTFSVSTTGPAIILDEPLNNTFFNSTQIIMFNYTATDPDGVDVCNLYGDWAGGWHLNDSFDDATDNETLSGNFSVEFNGDGNFKWNVMCNDTLSWETWALTNNTFTIDSIVPKISFSAGVENDESNFSRNWLFVNVSVNETNEANITFGLFNDEGLVNNSVFFDGTRSINFTNLNDDVYYYNVTIVDFANYKNFTETRTITLDFHNPNATLLSPENETFALNATQNFTANVSDNIGLLNATLYIFNSTGHLIYDSTVVLAGATFATVGIVYNFLSDGVFTWFYKVFDIAGNEYNTENRTITIDTHYPQIEYVNGTEDDGSEFERDFVFVNVSVSEGNFANMTYTLYNNTGGLTLVNETTYFNLTESINWTGLNDQNVTYFYLVKVVDLANQENSTATWSLKLIDVTNPSVYISSPQNLNYSYNESLDLNYSVSDLHLDECYYNLDNSTNVSLPGCLNATFNASQGSHVLYFYAEDELGNINNSEEVSFLVDSVEPLLDFVVPTPLNAGYWNKDSLFVNTSITEENVANVTYTLYNNTGGLVLLNETTYYEKINFINWTIAEGNYSYNASVFDIVNYNVSSEMRGVTVDLTYPEVSFGWGTEDNASEFERDWIYVDVSASDDNFANITFELYNDTAGLTLVNSTTYNELNLSINWTGLSDLNVTYYYNVSVTDLANNVNSTGARMIKLVDITLPSLLMTTPENKTYNYDTNIPLVYSASDTHLDGCWYNLDGGGNVTIPDCANTYFDAEDGLSHILYLFANDSLGLVNQTNVSFFVNSSLIFTDYYKVLRSSVFVDGSQDASIGETVDPAKSFVRHTSRSSDSGPDSLFVKGDFLNSQTLQFENYAAGAGANVEWEIVTGPDLSVQRDEVSYGTSNLTIQVPINQVDLSDSFIIISTSGNSGTQDYNQQARWRASFYNDTMVVLNRGVSGNVAGEISLQVVSWDGASVQGGSFSISSSGGTDSLTPVNLENSFLVFSSTTDSSTALDYNNVGGFIADANTVSFYRQDDDAGTMYADWFVVEAPFLDVRRGSFDITGGTSPVQTSFSAVVNSTRSFHTSYWDSTGDGTTHANAIVTTEITSTTNLQTITGTTAGNVKNVSYEVIEIKELDSPEISLSYPEDDVNFSGSFIDAFNFTVADFSSIANCSLFGNWSGGWHRNQTVDSPSKDIGLNFSSLNVTEDNFYKWNVECTDVYGNVGYGNSNFTFSSFLFPYSPLLFNISQTTNDGTGDVTLFWNSTNHSTSYKIYSGSDLSSLVYLDETSYLNYTDTSFEGNRRMFYQVYAVNPVGQNASGEYFGSHVYSLKHNGLTRNWVGFPTNFSYLVDADDTLNEITNATAVTMYNATRQRKVTCNEFSCPDFPSCTETNCNFGISAGAGYEVDINSSAPSEVNWSGVGIVREPVSVDLIKNSTSFGKNWISMTASTTLTNAQSLFESISNADAVTRWNSATQESEGLIYLPLFGGIYIGENFNINMEEGYEVSVTGDESWGQE
jgi:hypothetical protein